MVVALLIRPVGSWIGAGRASASVAISRNLREFITSLLKTEHRTKLSIATNLLMRPPRD